MSKSITIAIVALISLGLTIGLVVLKLSGPKDTGKDKVTDPIGYTDTMINTATPTHAETPTPPQDVIRSGFLYQAQIKTTSGTMIIDLNSKKTPVTTGNFVKLAKSGFYNNTVFHRVINGFMIQGGDPTGTGSGGPGYKFDDEPFEGEYVRGTVAMANAGPNTNGSQFFIMHKDYPLPKNYVIFGKVIAGLETVDKIATASVSISQMGEMSKPVSPVSIISVDITETPAPPTESR